jgi:Ca2+-binding RTX toxin-like protein
MCSTNFALNAGGGEDTIEGGSGNDGIIPGKGDDEVDAGAGNDVIYSEGGFRDGVNGGRGIDTCYVDSKDRVKGCERKR